MKMEDSEWFFRRLRDVCTKHSYDEDGILSKLQIIECGLGVPSIRQMLNNLLSEHHYDVVLLFSELLLKDHRSSYQALGRAFQRKCSAAPKELPELLRMRDRAAEGLSCFVAKYSIRNPWVKDNAPEVRLSRVFAKTLEEAKEKIEAQACAIIPGASLASLRIVNILDDQDAEMADVVSIRVSWETNEAPAFEVPSFSQANHKLLEWRNGPLRSRLYECLRIRVMWENNASYSFMATLNGLTMPGRLIEKMISDHIAFIFGEYVYNDRSLEEQKAKREHELADGALEHCGHIRKTCLLRDR